MALSGTTVKLLIFFLVFSIIFPTAGYAFTVGAEGTLEYGVLDAESLAAAGITLTDTDSENVSQDDAWVYFVLNASQYRANWKITGEWFEFSTRYLGLIWIEITPIHYKDAWVIGNFSTEYNWTHINLDYGGESQAHCFFTVYPGYDNISHCINDGNVTITIGRDFVQDPNNFWGFTSWFLGIVTGVNTYNLPTMFVWLMNLIIIVGVISGVLLIKEFIPFLP